MHDGRVPHPSARPSSRRRQPWLLADPGAFQLQNDSLTSISRIFSMAREGARPFGQTSVQFMIVRQRNSR